MSLRDKIRNFTFFFFFNVYNYYYSRLLAHIRIAHKHTVQPLMFNKAGEHKGFHSFGFDVNCGLHKSVERSKRINNDVTRVDVNNTFIIRNPIGPADRRRIKRDYVNIT